MFKAKDIKNANILAQNAITGKDYYCPCCKQLVLKRSGSNGEKYIRTHFAHYPNKPCPDSWYSDYDISDWHYNWQMKFPVENQEIALHLGSVSHRADIVVDRTVIEFQHSKLSANKFSERNEFYTNLGYKIVWLFDLSEEYNKGSLKNRGTCFVWDRPFNAFNHYSLVCGQNELFFQLYDSDNDACIVKIDEISTDGIKRFAVSPKTYTKEEFLQYLGKKNGTFPNPIEIIESNQEYLDFVKKYKISLNKQQERAVQSINGATLLLAVPGSGKTTVLIARLGYMIFCKGIKPENILALTYTKSATQEMSERFSKTFNCTTKHGVEFRTLNGICEKIIEYYVKTHKRTRFNLIESEAKRHEIIKEIIKKITNESPTKVDIINVEKAIQYIKNTMLEGKEEISKMPSSIENLFEIYEAYKAELVKIKGMDYDDQLRYALACLEKHPDILAHFQNQYPYICVDEAQDTSKLQHKILELLAKKYNNIFMVGDEDQSIYQFRGAYPRALLEFKNKYPNPYILYLENNYRSTPEIIECASHFIKHNRGRYDKKIVATRKNGKDVKFLPIEQRYTQYNYLEKVARNTTSNAAIIYRDNECAIPLINFFLKENIPFQTSSLKAVFFEHRDVHFIKNLYAFAKDTTNEEAFLSICVKFLGITKKSAEFICSKAKEKSISITESFCKYNKTAGLSKQEAFEWKAFIEKLCESDAKTTLPKILDTATMDFDATNIQVLRTISYKESTFENFVLRLDELKKIFTDNTSWGKEGIVLTTVHAAKGAEYDDVYLIDIFDGIFPRHNEDYYHEKGDLEMLQEERRIFYVALTRARNNLFIFDNTNEPSTFIDELKD